MHRYVCVCVCVGGSQVTGEGGGTGLDSLQARREWQELRRLYEGCWKGDAHRN